MLLQIKKEQSVRFMYCKTGLPTTMTEDVDVNCSEVADWSVDCYFQVNVD